MFKIILLCSFASTASAAGAGLGFKALATIQLQALPTVDLSGLTWQNSLQQLNGFGLFNLGVDAKKVVFILRNKKGNYQEQILDIDNPDTIANSTWDMGQKVIIVTHGYIEDATGGPLGPLSMTKLVFNEYANVGRDENLVFVDWSALARQLNYYDSVKNVELVGKRLAQFLVLFQNSNLIPSLQTVRIVGFSLGAHVAAVASNNTKPILGENIARITGLDPAGPGYLNAPLEKRLDPSDADFVDVIHTNGGTSVLNPFKYFGYPYNTGHIDFYPNGGATQPTCTVPLIGEVTGVCSHSKATEYFASTILGRKYIGCPCSDWATYQKGSCACTNGPLMGEFVDTSARGTYYLKY